MWCISGYEYVVGEAKMTKIFAVYLQASGFPSHSSEYAYVCCREQLGRYAVALSYLLLMLNVLLFCIGELSSNCWCTFPSGIILTYIISPALDARSVLLEFALSRNLSRR